MIKHISISCYLIEGEGFEPKAEPLPVVKLTTLQPVVICPVTEADHNPDYP